MSSFSKSGIYRLDSNNSNNHIIYFIDPVRILNRSYTRFQVSPFKYYSRFLKPKHEQGQTRDSENLNKKNRKKRKFHRLNERELVADQRHQEARSLLLNAHEVLLRDKEILSVLCNLRDDDDVCCLSGTKDGPCFIEHGSVWQAPMYEICLHFCTDDGGSALVQFDQQQVVPLYNNLIINDTSEDVEAATLDNCYIIPRESCFHMSNLEQLHALVPDKPDTGFNLIVIDPPWENRSAHQKSVYPTVPNRYFLSLPISQLTHTQGSLVALWVTNREKLRRFVEKELFPTWGVSYKAVVYWLKVKVDGSLISELDLFHHRPYECLLLGYRHGKGMDSEPLTTKSLPENQVIISVPGDYSRKPPIGGILNLHFSVVRELLLDYAPGPKPARCIELFARELLAGCTSWGNEPLHFQHSRYFLSDATVDVRAYPYNLYYLALFGIINAYGLFGGSYSDKSLPTIDLRFIPTIDLRFKNLGTPTCPLTTTDSLLDDTATS
ncbi:hypothetical protein IFM89_010985 [Coptis chinensis]|uniref:Methyltransferase-like protein 2 n=1 Tax=Coptis chinensis TaxID=261450 RepID=A0A835ILY1_9MAGN|nr:hypothetical protein IFM89_010985 [Coptis chinensis]